jgi:hypothetical protein
MSKKDRIDKADKAFHAAAFDLGDALDFARSKKSKERKIDAFGKAVMSARRLIAADEKLHALSNAGYEDAAIRTDQRLADAFRGVADELAALEGSNDPKVIKLRGLVEELVQVELPGASAI